MRTLLAVLALSGRFPFAAAAPSAPPLVRVIAHEYAFQAPDTVQAGPTTFRLVSKGKEMHVMPIVRIAPGHTAGELFDALTHHAPTPWITSLGGVGTVPPGDSAKSIIDLSPGLYAMWCDIAGRDSVPHFMKGMFHAFTVVGPPNRAAMPRADVTVELSEFKFGMPDTLAAGRHVIEVRNVGTQTHMALLWRLNPRVSLDSAMRWIADPAPRTDRPITIIGGVSDLSPGQRVHMLVDLAPGRYMLICLDEDVHDHKPHFMHGMVRRFAVVPE
jgi:hypothetical protein